MTHNEPDLEAVILQKLEDMEDFLKSFMSSLKEPLQKELLEPVYSPATGKVQWEKRHGQEVRADEYLGVVKKGNDRWEIRSPAMGRLLILPKWGEVGIGETIAYIKLTSTIV